MPARSTASLTQGVKTKRAVRTVRRSAIGGGARSRYYNPAHGRFLEQDTYRASLLDPQQLNRYLYCASDPVNHVDPSGNIGIVGIVVISLLAVLLVCLLRYAYVASGLQTHYFEASAKDIDFDADMRMRAAVSVLIRYSSATRRDVGRNAADFMEAKIKDHSVKGNPGFDDRASTPQYPNVPKELRMTTISTHPRLSFSDIACQLLGEYQRRVGDLDDDPNVLNREVEVFQEWLRSVNASPVRDWAHPE